MNIVILAAGMGKRMHSKLPKVLQPLAGRPMLDYVLNTVDSFAARKTLVVGHCAEGSVRISVSGEVIPGAAQRGCPLYLRCSMPDLMR